MEMWFSEFHTPDVKHQYPGKPSALLKAERLSAN